MEERGRGEGEVEERGRGEGEVEERGRGEGEGKREGMGEGLDDCWKNNWCSWGGEINK